MWQNLANIASQYGQTLRQEQADAPIRAQEAQLRDLQIKEGQSVLADRTAAQRHDAAFRDAIVQGAPDEDLVKMDPERAEKFINGRDAIVKAKQSGYADRQKILHDVTLGIDAVPDELKADAYAQKRRELLSNGVIQPKDAPEQFDPQWFKQTLNYARSPEVQANLEKTKAETEKARAEAKKATAEALAGPKPSAEQDTQRAVDIRTRLNLKQPVSPADQAWLQSHESEKTLGVDTTAAEASRRQAEAIGAQVASQKRQQDFEALKEARSAIQKDVNTPYLTAKTSADTLRDTVAAAQQGNKIAGSLQALETTMSAIRAQGLNRINAAEIGVTGNAGSMYDRIKGWLGKAAEGQPVPADVQKDMTEFADILEKAAYKKYKEGHAATNKLYGTSIPEMLTGPTDQQGSTPSAIPVVGSNFQGGKVLKVEKVQ